MINASVDMLNHLGHKQHAKVITDAIYQTIVTDAIRTPGISKSYVTKLQCLMKTFHFRFGWIC